MLVFTLVSVCCKYMTKIPIKSYFSQTVAESFVTLTRGFQGTDAGYFNTVITNTFANQIIKTRNVKKRYISGLFYSRYFTLPVPTPK